MKTIKHGAALAIAIAMFGMTAVHAQTAVPVADESVAPADAFYADLGGKEGIQKFVDTLIPMLLTDDRIKNSFKGVDMKRLGVLLQEQFCQLSGGPCKYSGKGMKLMHDGLNITNAQFNALAEDLQTAMDMHDVPSRAQNKLLAKLAPMQRDIVTK